MCLEGLLFDRFDLHLRLRNNFISGNFVASAVTILREREIFSGERNKRHDVSLIIEIILITRIEGSRG